MKILLVAKPWKGGLANYLFRTLEELFPGEVLWLPTRPATARERWAYRRDKTSWQRRLLDKIRQTPCRAAIFVNHLPLFEELPRRPEHVLWLTDGPRPKEGELSPYGRVFLSDPGYAAEVIEAVGAERYAGELPFGCFPSIHRPQPGTADRGVCFIGNRDPKRDEHLGRLLAAGVRPTIVGNYFLHHPLFWRHPGCFRPAVANERQGVVYARHRLSLNIHAAVVRRGTNMRTFEAAAYGIPQLVEYREGLETLFEPEREIAVYRTPDELPARVEALLADPEAASTMARRARERALREHSYRRRVAQMLADLVPVAEG